MCPCVGPHAPSFGRQLWGLPSRMQYLPPQEVLLPRVYSTMSLTPVARGAGPRCLAGDPLLDRVLASLSPVASMAPGDICHGPQCSLAKLRPAALGYRPCCWPGGSAGSPQCAPPWGCGLFSPNPRPPYMRTCVRCPRPPSAQSQVCARGVFCVFLVRCPGPLGSFSPVCPLSALCCVCGVLGNLAPGHWCACSVPCVVSAPSSATSLLFRGSAARCVVLPVPCPGPLSSGSPVGLLGVLSCVSGVLGHLAPVPRCTRSVRDVACAVSLATWLPFTGVLAWCVVLRV